MISFTDLQTVGSDRCKVTLSLLGPTRPIEKEIASRERNTFSVIFPYKKLFVSGTLPTVLFVAQLERKKLVAVFWL